MQASLTDRPGWLWWLAAAALGVLIAVWWQPRMERPVVSAPTAAPTPAPVVASRAPAPAPARSTAPVPSETAPPSPALKLVGTVLAGPGSFATVRRTSDSQLLQLRVGDRIDGLAVGAIESERVVLTGAAQPVVIEADPAATASAPPLPARAISPPPAVPVEQPVFAEGQAPWDLAPPFRH